MKRNEVEKNMKTLSKKPLTARKSKVMNSIKKGIKQNHKALEKLNKN